MVASPLLNAAIRARQMQDVETAVDAIDLAQKAAPTESQVAAVRAQLHYESWRPASHLFATAATLNPTDLQLVRNHALALVSEGDAAAAQQILNVKLRAHPDWIEGHNILSRIRVTSVFDEDHDSSFKEACAAHRENIMLQLAWFHNAAVRKDWAKVRSILEDAERDFPGSRALRPARFFLAAESGEPAEGAYAEVADIVDPGLDLCRVRYHLRRGDLAEAETYAMRNIGLAASNMFWPYLSLIWRLTGSRHAAWLDGDPQHVSVIDLDFSEEQIGNLADTLRKLHILQAPYPEQSVRGGTQTDRPLFFNPDPVIQSARGKIMDAVLCYVGSLPVFDTQHPLFAPAHERLLFDGSWSVRLDGKGFHASHTHVNGWISSAFYVSLPDNPGPAPSGWLALGTPPPELNLDLPAYSTVEPKPGRLVLFPSTMWHSTIPFEAGERLTIAFDIRRP